MMFSVIIPSSTIILVLHRSKKKHIPYLPYKHYMDSCEYIYSSKWIPHNDSYYQMLILSGVKNGHPLGSLLLTCMKSETQPVIDHEGPRAYIQVKPRMIFDGESIHGCYVDAFESILTIPRYNTVRSQTFLKSITGSRHRRLSEASDSSEVDEIEMPEMPAAPSHTDIAHGTLDAIRHLRNSFQGLDDYLQMATSRDHDCTDIIDSQKHLLNALKSVAKSNDLAICLPCVKSDAYEWYAKPGEPCPTCAAVLRA